MENQQSIVTRVNTTPTTTLESTTFALGPDELIDGRYRIERELGRGAMGVVYEATDTGLGRRVALKVITRDLASDPSFVDRFLLEAKALAAIRHQNIVQVHSLGQHGGVTYYAMEFVQGRTLEAVVADRIASGESFPVREVINILRQVASGLSAVHAARIIHRDVKPANIILEHETGRPVLLDFGIASPAFNSSTRATLMVGSPAYMAPEQIHARPNADLTPAADLYAFGCVAYELLALRPPFNSQDVYEVLRDQVSITPDPVSTHRAEASRLDSLIARLLSKRPEDRPSGCLAVMRELERLSIEEESEARASVMPARPSLLPGETARVLLVSNDRAFRARARLGCSLAFRGAWKELWPDCAPDETITRLRSEPPMLVVLHCDDLPDGGVGFVSRLRDLLGARTLVVACGSNIDALDRWRLGALGVSRIHPATLSGEDLAALFDLSFARERHSGMPGPRQSTMFLPLTTAQNPAVPVELFLLVVACAWADGALPPLTGARVLEAARAENHDAEALAAIERACLAPIELVDVDVSELPMDARAYAFAFATSLALVDGAISRGAEPTLHVLAFLLGLTTRERTAIQSAVEQAAERGAVSARDSFRYNDYLRTVAPVFERALLAPAHSPIQGLRLPHPL